MNVEEVEGVSKLDKQERKPGIRVDGGRRRILDKDRVAARMAGVAKNILTPAEITARKKATAERGMKGEKLARALRKIDGGKEGAKETKVQLRISGQRTTTQTIRARPGTFEWRYGRDKQGALFHAGSQFAHMWEKAGATVASSVDFMKGTAGGFISGMAESRIEAIDQLRGAVVALGNAPTDRLINYCVKGQTSTELAAAYQVKERDMAAVLASDLRACAQALRFAA